MFVFINEDTKLIDESLKYDIKNLQELRKNNWQSIGTYLKFSVKDDNGNEIVFYTNGEGEGKWYYDTKNHNYKQNKGTSQFSMKNWSDAKARKYLKDELEKFYSEQEHEKLKSFFK